MYNNYNLVKTKPVHLVYTLRLTSIGNPVYITDSSLRRTYSTTQRLPGLGPYPDGELHTGRCQQARAYGSPRRLRRLL